MSINLVQKCILRTRFTRNKTFVVSNILKLHNRSVFNDGNGHKPRPIQMAYTLLGGDEIKDEVPVIIMHGLFGSKNNWNSLSKSIQKKTNKKVYTVDARNHGDSPHTKEHTYLHLAEDIRLFLEEHGIKKAALIGHSMGGRAVMAFALKYEKQVESLTVVDISPIGTTEGLTAMHKVIKAMQSVKLKEGISLFEARRTVESQLNNTIGDPRIASFLTLNLIEKSRGNFTWKVNVDDIEKAYDPHILLFPYKTGEFCGPTLFIMGGESDYVRVDKDEYAIRILFLDTEFETIEGAGHWLHVEKPAEFLDIACKFINEKKPM